MMHGPVNIRHPNTSPELLSIGKELTRCLKLQNHVITFHEFNSLNAELNPICHLLVL